MQIICKRGGQAVSFPLEKVAGKAMWCWRPSKDIILETELPLKIESKPSSKQVQKKPAARPKQQDQRFTWVLFPHLKVAKERFSKLVLLES